MTNDRDKISPSEKTDITFRANANKAEQMPPPHPLEQSQQDPARLDGVYSTMQMSIVPVLTHFPDEALAHAKSVDFLV